MEARVEGVEGGGGGVEEALGGAVEVGAAGEKAFARLSKSLTRIVAEDGGGQLGNAGLAEAE